MQPKSIEIITMPSISITELVDQMQQGFSVMRSAHIGNFSPYNLTLAANGIPILCVDHNITGVDRNYFPESILRTSQQDVIAPLGTLSCKTQVTKPGVLDDAPQTVFLDDLHIQAIQAVIPNAEIFTNTNYLRRNESIAREVVKIAFEVMPTIFTRGVTPDGKPYDLNGYGRHLLGRKGIMQLTDNPREQNEAVIMPNILDMEINFIVEALNSGRSKQFHISGPDMVQYIASHIPTLQKLHRAITERASFAKRLPENIEVMLVPGAHAKFATTLERSPVLNRALALAAQLEGLDQERNSFFKEKPQVTKQESQDFIDTMRQKTRAVGTDLNGALEEIPELFVEVRKTGFITQYDAAAEGGLFIHPINQQETFSKLKSLFETLKKTRQKIKQ